MVAIFFGFEQKIVVFESNFLSCQGRFNDVYWSKNKPYYWIENTFLKKIISMKNTYFYTKDSMRSYFPILDSCVYLNTAYTGPLSSDLLEWRSKDDISFLTLGDHYKTKLEKQYYQEAREAVARFVNSEEKTTFITANFSSAFQNFIVQLPKSFRFLVVEDEYPSLTGLISNHGFSSKEIPMTHLVEQAIWEELHLNNYQVLTLSAVQYTSGILLDMNWLVKIKEAFPELLLLVDGTQFIGAHQFDFSASPIDGIFGSSYKWLMAGYGTGFALLKKELLTRLNIPVAMLDQAYDRGQLSVKALGSLALAVNTLLDQDFIQLMEIKDRLANYLKAGLSKRNLLDEIVEQREKHSSIFNIQLNRKQYESLLAENVRCIWRGNGVRIAVHHYNTKEDIDRFFNYLDKLL